MKIFGFNVTRQNVAPRQIANVQGSIRTMKKDLDDWFNPVVRTGSWSPQASTVGSSLDGKGMGDRASFFRFLRDTIPILSAGVSAWVNLCATRLVLKVEGTEEQKKQIESVIADLEKHLLDDLYGRVEGFDKLMQGLYQELFTIGRFAAELVLNKEGNGIDRIRFINAYEVQWKRSGIVWQPFSEIDGKEYLYDPNLFFYTVLNVDLSNPSGIEPLACIPLVSEIEQMMLQDMARSSHNAGTPRLQVKITRPERLNWEADIDYANRVSLYFTDTARQFNKLEADDNIFTWDDVTVDIVGGTKQSTWRFDRELVIEDCITGLKLFPWVLGRTLKTAKTWVQSQFDLLMLMVLSHQKRGLALADWIVKKELELRGIKSAEFHFEFAPHNDPFEGERATAEKTRIDNVNTKVASGYISKDDGARELGYSKSYNQDPVVKSTEPPQKEDTPDGE